MIKQLCAGVPVVVGVILVMATSVVYADEYLDPPSYAASETLIRGMHGCEEAHLLTGIQGRENKFLCASERGGQRVESDPGSRIVDAATQLTVEGVTVHACPVGFAVKGVHIDKNLLTCERAKINDSDVNTRTTVRQGMLACSENYLVKGMNIIDRNVLILACVRVRDTQVAATNANTGAMLPLLLTSLVFGLGGYRLWWQKRKATNWLHR